VGELLASPLGVLVGLALGALGGGGSILAVPVLVFVADQSPQSATGTSLVVVAAAALVGMADHWRAGRVRARAGIAFGLSGVGGSVLGSSLNRRLDGDVLLLAFSGLILLAAWRMVTGCPSCTRVGEQAAVVSASGRGSGIGVASRLPIDRRTAIRFLAAGTVVGFFTGLFGVGGGFIIVPALTLLLAFNMPQAVGTSLLVIAINAAVALAARLGTAGIDWSVTILFGSTALVGVLTGSRMSGRIPARALTRWFAGLLVVVAVYTAARSII
jgi:uncharacterized membrane protein YfcA